MFSIFSRGFYLLILFLALVMVGPTAQATDNLLSNPDFDVDVSGWPDPYPDADTLITHDTTMDHDDTPGVLGSLKLSNSITNGAADGPAQCVELEPATTYIAAGAIFRPTQANKPQAYLDLTYFASTDCTGPASGGHTGGGDYYLPSDIDDEWYDAEFETTTFGSTHSAKFRLFSGNTTDPTHAYVYFDNIYLPEPENPLLMATAAAVLLALSYLRRKATARG